MSTNKRGQNSEAELRNVLIVLSKSDLVHGAYLDHDDETGEVIIRLNKFRHNDGMYYNDPEK